MSLRFNVSRLSHEEIGSVREHEVVARVLVSDEPAHADFTGLVSMLRTKDGVLVTAKLAGKQAATCSRCLRETSLPIGITLEEEFLLSVDPHTNSLIAPPEDPDVFRVDERHILDLEEAVRQAWTSALPIQPLCREDCAGLCSQCGQDLNLRACSCSPALDERWDVLRELARELKGT